MRNFTKLALIAGASIALAACGGSETATTAENTSMSEMNSMDSMATTNDMTAVDGAMDNTMGMDNMAMDNMGMDNMSNAM